MATYTLEQNSYIFHEGNPVTKLCIIIKGSVIVNTGFSTLKISAGNMIGISDIFYGNYISDYIAAENVTLYSYEYSSPDDLKNIIETKPEISGILISALYKIICTYLKENSKLKHLCTSLYKYLTVEYKDYNFLCSKYSAITRKIPEIDELKQLSNEYEISPWLYNYYNALNSMPSALKNEYYSNNSFVCVGELLNTSQHLYEIHNSCISMLEYLQNISSLLINDTDTDYFELLSALSFKVHRNYSDTSQIDNKINSAICMLKQFTFIDSCVIDNRINDYYNKLNLIDNINNISLDNDADNDDNSNAISQITDSLNTILDFAHISTQESEEFKNLIRLFNNLSDKNSIDSEAAALRKNITNKFYDIYEAVVNHALPIYENISIVIKMFLYFGYVDEHLAGMDNSITLYKLAKSRKIDTSSNILSFFEWILKIYKGEAAPSRNVFDVDYEADLRIQKKRGNITDNEEQAYLNDNQKKVSFELKNMFRNANVITFGHVSSFFPVFSEHNLIRPLSNSYVTDDILNEAIDKLLLIDYTAFYREVQYSSPENKIRPIFISKEIKPDIILMPTIGERGAMWQEIARSRRDTSARFMISIINTQNIDDILIRLTGEFRWELCKRIEGARWNDLSNKSLTSEYCDYAQFFKKNNELSADAKEKIKVMLQRSKNNFKEMFTRDYISWIKFESNGSTRLNKVVRRIMMTYCPFSQPVRDIIANNPMFHEFLEKYYILQAKKHHSIEVLLLRLEKEGAIITPELEQYLKLYIDH